MKVYWFEDDYNDDDYWDDDEYVSSGRNPSYDDCVDGDVYDRYGN